MCAPAAAADGGRRRSATRRRAARDADGGAAVSDLPHRHRCRRHLHRRGLRRRRRHRRPWPRPPPRRPTRARAWWTASACWPNAWAWRCPTCWRARNASSTAPRSPPTRCWNAGCEGRDAHHRGPSRRHRDARGAEARTLRPAPAAPRPRWCRAACACRCASASAPMGAWRCRSIAASLDAAIATLKAEQVEAVAICFLHAWRDDAHERAAAEAVRAALPGVFVTTLRRGAAADQGVRALLHRLRERLCRADRVALSRAAARAAGRGRLQRPALRHPVPWRRRAGRGSGAARRRHRAVGSGGRRRGRCRAGAARAWARTSSPSMSAAPPPTSRWCWMARPRSAAAAPWRASASRWKASTSSRSAPAAGRSAMSAPAARCRSGRAAPARCRGRSPMAQGGTEPTVTDANLVLGYLDAGQLPRRRAQARPRRRAGGLRRAGRERSASTPWRRAEGVHRLANVRMADGIRVATVRRGVDPRDFTLLAFGGAAGLHATRGGARTRDARASRCRSSPRGSRPGACCTPTCATRWRAARSAPAACRRTPRCAPSGPGWKRKAAPASPPGSAARSRRSAPPTCAMANRSSRSPCRSRPCDWDAPGLQQRVTDAFHARHEALFTYALRGGGGGAGQCPPRGDRPAAADAGAAGRAGARAGRALRDAPRAARRRRGRRCRCFDFAALAPGQVVAGPAIVESDTTTVLLLPGDAARMDGRGWLDIALPGDAA